MKLFLILLLINFSLTMAALNAGSASVCSVQPLTFLNIVCAVFLFGMAMEVLVSRYRGGGKK